MRSVLLAATVGLMCAACAGDDGQQATVQVFAAASLTEAFEAMEAPFEADHPEWDVTFSFAASSELVAQIRAGAPADVFASADLRTMTALADSGGVADNAAEIFTTNVLEIVVPPGNPDGLTGLADLADPRLVFVVCARQVPCGGYATDVLANADVAVVPDSYEANPKAVVTKVALGEADAGLAYATDVLASGEVDGLPIPPEVNVVAEYPIAVTAEALNPGGASAFVEFVTGSHGQAILAEHGFGGGPGSSEEPSG